MQTLTSGPPACMAVASAMLLLAAPVGWTAGDTRQQIADRAPPARGSDANRDADTREAATLVSPTVRPLRDALVPRIDAARERFAIPALSLVLVHSDEVLWAEGFGEADPGRGRPASADTVYRAGSLAKPFTALATLRLAVAGRLDIDGPLAAALPGFSIRHRFDGSVPAITPRMLLSHHSGLPSDLHKGLWSDTPFTTVRTRLRDECLAFPPRQVFGYSNVGYSLLGHMVQRVAAEPFDVHLGRTLFRPLGMSATRIAVRPSAADGLAVGHRHGRALAPLPIRDLPAQGLMTSARDLGRFLKMLLCGGELAGRQVVEPGPIEAMLAPQNQDVALDLDVTTGLGWFLETGRIPGAERLARHGGATLGYAAELMLLPEVGLGVAVLASSGDAQRIVGQLAESVLARSLSLVPEPLPPDLFVPAGDGPDAVGSAVSAKGHFATDLGLVAFEAGEADQDHTLCACMTGERLDMVRGADGWLGVDAMDRDALPPSARTLAAMRYQTRRIGGRDVLVADIGDGEAVIGEKVPAAPVPAAWRARLGHYAVINPDPDYPVSDLRLSLVDGKLCLSYRMPVLSPKRIQMPVQPLDEDTGVILGLGRNRGDALRFVEQGGGSLLRWSGYLARPLGDGDP